MARTRRRKKRTHVREGEDPTKKGEPKSFVFRRGRHAVLLRDLEKDLRRLLSPNTAAALKESRKNQLKDFVASMWQGPPLVVMNNFSSPGAPAGGAAGGGKKDKPAEQLQLATALFQSLFPPINRVLLLDHSRETGRIALRHFSIGVAPSGVSKNLKVGRALLARKGLPDMGRMADVAEFLTRSGYGSESEGEDAEVARVTLQQDLGKGNVTQRQSRVRLHEVGPRMELEIVKVEEGLCDGRVLYHAYEQRDTEEAAAQEEEHEARRRLKEQRRREQEENVRRKQADKRRREKVEEERGEGGRGGKRPRKQEREQEAGQEADDDVEWYRKEVGEEPDDAFGLGRGGGGGRGFRGGRGAGRGRRGAGRGGRGGAGGGGRGGRGGAGGGDRRGPKAGGSDGKAGGKQQRDRQPKLKVKGKKMKR
eukprot:scaffold2.g7231.t1